MSERRLAAVIMAAGKGTRMNDPSMAKVMYPVGGVPMIDHVVARALECSAERVITIVGHQRESVMEHLGEAFAGKVEFAVQEEQLGTGHAIMQSAPVLGDFEGDVLILSGDVPLMRTATLKALIVAHRTHNAAATVLTVNLEDPTGYGRIIRDEADGMAEIIEHKDATAEQRAIAEINSGIYVFNASDLLESLKHLSNHNAQGEYYLTDVFKWLRGQGRSLRIYRAEDFNEVHGINTVEQLGDADRRFRATYGTPKLSGNS